MMSVAHLSQPMEQPCDLQKHRKRGQCQVCAGIGGQAEKFTHHQRHGCPPPLERSPISHSPFLDSGCFGGDTVGKPFAHVHGVAGDFPF